MKKAFFFLLFIFLINLPSIYYGWYLQWIWFDAVLHFLGGFFMAMFMYHYLKEHLREGAFIKNLLIVAGATAFIGVCWEFAEFIANQTLIEPTYKYFGIQAYFMGDLVDTVADLFLDISGAIIFFCLNLLWLKKTGK